MAGPPGTVGRARPGRTLTTDAEDRIWCAVPSHARFTYLGAPEQTAAAWRDTPAGPAFTVGTSGGSTPTATSTSTGGVRT